MGSNVVVVGSSNTDMTVNVPKMPGRGETVLGGTFYMACGGKGANQAVAAARAGAEAAFVGCVGDDMFGRQALQELQQEGINTDHMRVLENTSSGVALIFVDKEGDNSIAVAPGANHELQPEHIERLQPPLQAADVLMLQLEIPIATVKAAARVGAAHGTKVVLNPAPAQLLGKELLQHVSIITPNENEAALLTGVSVDNRSGLEEAAGRLLSNGVEAVLITLGAQGVYAATEKWHQHIPGRTVEAVDTTAAGDVFNGVLAAALAEGQRLEAAARLANTAAALSVTRRGAQPSAPHRAEVMEMHRSSDR